MYIALGIAAVLALIVAYAAMQPGAFRIARSRVIYAPPAAVFGLINDFHRWSAWSPWEKLDPTMARTFEGEAAGPGAVYRWSGNKKAGAGSMTIRDAIDAERIEIDLHFLKPFEAENKTVFTLEPVEGGTRVTWAMEGVNKLGARVFTLLVNMDKLVGADFERGLDAMNTAATAA